MKTVFSPSQTIHVWASRSQEEGRSHPSGGGGYYRDGHSGSSVYFIGDTLYSYGPHWIMARLLPMADGRIAVFVNGNSRSVTTNKHTNMARRASTQYPQFVVDNPGGSPQEELDFLTREFASALETAAQANKRNRPKKLEIALELIARADAIAAAFDLSHILAMPDDLMEWLEAARVRRAEEDAAHKERYLAQQQDAIWAWARGSEPWRALYANVAGGYRDLANAEQLALRAQTEEYGVKTWREHATVIRIPPRANDGTWLADADEIVAARGVIDGTDPDIVKVSNCLPARVLLRLSRMRTEAGQLIETSKGAEFPVEHAKRAFKMLSAMKENDALPYRRDDNAQGYSVTMRLGHFTIDAVDKDGNVTAGCHFVEWREIEDMAMRLGLVSRDTREFEQVITDEYHYAGVDFEGEK